MRISQLVDPRFKDALNKLVLEPLPLRVAFKLKGVIKKVDEEFAKYEECRREALKRFGKKKEDGSLELDDNGNVVFEDGSIQEFVKELGELVAVEVSLEKVKISELGENIKITVDELMILDDLLTE